MASFFSPFKRLLRNLSQWGAKYPLKDRVCVMGDKFYEKLKIELVCMILQLNFSKHPL